mgnify:CR=1 FL=1
MSLSKNRAEEIIKSLVAEFNGVLVSAGEGMFIALDVDQLVCISADSNRLISSLQANKEQISDGIICKVCDLNNINAELVRRNIKWTTPSAVGNAKSKIVAVDESAKELESMSKQGIKPVFAPQNPQEKNYRGFLDQLTWKVVQAGYKNGYAASAGLLQTEEEIVAALVLGYSQLTLDCTTKINIDTVGLSTEQLDEKYAALPEDFRSKLEASYLEKKFKTADGNKIKFELADLKRIALTYAEVIVYARYVYSTYLNNTPWPVDFVIAMNTAKVPLTEQASYLVLNELERLGVRASALD